MIDIQLKWCRSQSAPTTNWLHWFWPALSDLNWALTLGCASNTNRKWCEWPSAERNREWWRTACVGTWNPQQLFSVFIHFVFYSTYQDIDLPLQSNSVAMMKLIATPITNPIIVSTKPYRISLRIVRWLIPTRKVFRYYSGVLPGLLLIYLWCEVRKTIRLSTGS